MGRAAAEWESVRTNMKERKLHTRKSISPDALLFTPSRLETNIPPPLPNRSRLLSSSRLQVELDGREKAWTDPS
jgi:hypothetical protein